MKPGPLKWHGGKAYLAQKIVDLMPSRDTWLHYVEPYFGGGAVLLANDPEGVSEVVNDLNEELTNFWRCLQNETAFAVFRRECEACPFSEVEFKGAMLRSNELMRENTLPGIAFEFFVRCRQSLAGRMKGFTGITKTRTRRGMNNEVSAWLTAIDGLPAVHERLKRVLILNRDALDVIRQQDGPRTLFYLDPPYLHETRSSNHDYEFEMTNDDHVALVNDLLPSLKGRFLLSGYHSSLYDTTAELYRWHCHEFELPNQAAGGKVKRIMTECVWTNY